MSKLDYKYLECEVCGEKTSHVTVDTRDGPFYQCEICGTFNEKVKPK